jgi:hypothetical protein
MARLRTLALVLPLLLGSGCVVLSLKPYAPEKERLEAAPEALQGRWRAVRIGDQTPPEKAWELTDSTLLTYDMKGRAGRLETIFFRLGEELYCDFTSAPPPEDGEWDGPGEFWMFHTAPLHSLVRVDREEDELRFTLAQYGWFKAHLQENPKALAHTTWQDGMLFFIASPEEWYAFLEEHHQDEDCFAEKPFIVLRRLPAAEEAQTPPAADGDTGGDGDAP